MDTDYLKDISTMEESVDKINNGLLHDVKLVSTRDISMHPGISTMFTNYQESSVKGIQEQSSVSDAFFSNENVEILHATIRYKIHLEMNQIIDKQSSEELFVVMRSTFLQFGNASVSSDNVINDQVENFLSRYEKTGHWKPKRVNGMSAYWRDYVLQKIKLGLSIDKDSFNEIIEEAWQKLKITPKKGNHKEILSEIFIKIYVI